MNRGSLVVMPPAHDDIVAGRPVSVRAIGHDSGMVRVEVEVEDRGVGIRTQVLPTRA